MSAQLSPGIRSLQLLIDTPKDQITQKVRDDLLSVKVWYSTVSNFDPATQGTLVFDGLSFSITIPNLTASTVYYVKYAFVSNIDPSVYVVSSQLSATVLADPSAVSSTPGTRGSRQLYSNDTNYNSGYRYLTNTTLATSYAAKATDLIAAATTGSTPTTPINGDTVTFTNGTTYVYTITYNGTSWTPPGTVIDGSLLVTGSITAAKIDSTGLEVKDTDGKVILSTTQKLASTYIDKVDANQIKTGTINVGLNIQSTDGTFVVDFINKYISITV